MKIITLNNGTEKLFINGQEVDHDYKTSDYIKAVINHPGREGFSIDDIRQRLKISELLAKAGEDANSIDLEDTDYEMVKGLVKNHKWGANAKSILEFSEQFS